MWYLLEGQCRLYEAGRAIATAEYFRLEVGRYKHELHRGLTNDSPQVWFNLGDRGSTLQICTLHTYQHQLQGLEVCRDLHSSCVMLTQSSKDDNFWSRFTVCRSLLGATTRVPRDSLDPQFGLSPSDGWLNWASQPNSWRYAESMCSRTSRKLGPESGLGRVLLQ
jgi:hypothetical protein